MTSKFRIEDASNMPDYRVWRIFWDNTEIAVEYEDVSNRNYVSKHVEYDAEYSACLTLILGPDTDVDSEIIKEELSNLNFTIDQMVDFYNRFL